MKIIAQETHKKDHYFTYLPQKIIQQLKRRRINIIIEEPIKINSQKGQVQDEKSQYPKDVVVLKKIISFILNAFQKFLRARDDPNSKNLEQKIIELKSLKKKAKQQAKQASVKLEIKELKQLMEWKEGSLDFSTLFIKYLKSKELKDYIDKNKKIKSIPTKDDYHKAVKLVFLELQKKDKLFVKFISKNQSFQEIVLNEYEYDSFDSKSQFEEEQNDYSKNFLVRDNLQKNYHGILGQ
ncbi:unnamed protein product [Paramecium sonneborni]|uniref:Uncharacterized protein n=1 Tax=Paramecium sonneborni TaxID=65129 RepID=A0A8S1LM30_9CILI|nr:unnamed protein product [Paramecium sonneborni]